jgi:hypothetical protein
MPDPLESLTHPWGTSTGSKWISSPALPNGYALVIMNGWARYVSSFEESIHVVAGERATPVRATELGAEQTEPSGRNFAKLRIPQSAQQTSVPRGPPLRPPRCLTATTRLGASCPHRYRQGPRLGTCAARKRETGMALDIYVGSLTRYYAGEWETVGQRQARETGGVAPARVDAPGDAIRDPEEIRPIVTEWRQGIAAALKESVVDPFDWDESGNEPYSTDQLGRDVFTSLRLWAAYAEHPDLPRPTALVADLATDPAFLRSNNPEGTSAYHQLIREIELWLPWDFSFTFRAETPAGGSKVGLGSVPALRKQLAELNSKTWRASSEATLASWRRDVPSLDAPLEVFARFGFGVLYPLAALAEKGRTLLKLDT